jgi:anti-sigma B factor antagonist
MTLRITITEEKDAVIMAPAGRIDSLAMDELQEGFEQVKQTGKSNIILLLRDLEHINSQGIGAFLSFFEWAKQAGGVVRLAEVPPRIMESLNLLGLDGLVKVYPSLSKAEENYRIEAVSDAVYEGVELGNEGGLEEVMTPERSRMPYVLAGAGFVILAIIVFLFLKPANRPAAPAREITTKLDVLERKVSHLEGEGEALSQLEARVESISTSVSERLALIEKQIAALKGDVDAMKKTAESVSSPKREPEPLEPTAYHVVAKGETLYRIALRYKMSLEALRRLNNLKPGQPLLLGQRLLVKPQKPN